MKVNRAKCLLILFIGLTVFQAWGQSAPDLTAEDQLRAANEKVEYLLKELRVVKNRSTTLAFSKSADGAEPLLLATPNAPPKRCVPAQTCVPNCLGRHSNGECYSYGSDFCAPNAVCSAQCLGRHSDGTCYSFGEDYCGSFANCAPNCLGRHSNGQCYSYGPDVCS